jgi:hypothetical protein
LYSSAANHTIAEATGLVYAGVLFPEFSGAERWRSIGIQLLSREVERQVLPDGGGAEQTFAYLRQITDLASLARGIEPHLRVLDDRIAAARRFLVETQGAMRALEIGDDDGGHALSRHWRNEPALATDLAHTVTFPDAGVSVLRSRSPEGHQILFRHGTLGLSPLNGHGHASLLSITWQHRDRELLVDTGTYTYTGDARWRRHFRGTSAHNTVSVDGRDQSTQRGAFLWHPDVRARLVHASDDEFTTLLATHDGFRGLPVRHWRGIVYGHGGRLLVWDRVEGRGTHSVSLWWHLAADAELWGERIVTEDLQLRMGIQGAGELRRYRGSVQPIAGWRSLGYGHKRPNTCIEARYSGRLPSTFLTVIEVGAGADVTPTPEELQRVALLDAWVCEEHRRSRAPAS